MRHGAKNEVRNNSETQTEQSGERDVMTLELEIVDELSQRAEDMCGEQGVTKLHFEYKFENEKKYPFVSGMRLKRIFRQLQSYA